MTTVKNIYDYINSFAPFDLQEEWDNSGFLIGDFRKEVKTVVLSLDATKGAARFAESVNADLLLTHHPVIFRGIHNIKKDSAVYTLVNNDIAVICAHTSFDRAIGGINDNLCKILGLKNVQHIDDTFIVTAQLDNEMSIDDFAQFVSETLGTNGIRYTDTEKTIKTVAVGGGACSEYIDTAMKISDCFLTGDLKYHEMLDAAEQGYAVISSGHFESENKPFLMLKEKLEKLFTDVNFIIAPTENPVLTV